MRLLPLFLRQPMETVFERRLAATLTGLPRPQHIGIMLDGNRRREQPVTTTSGKDIA